MRSCPPAPQRSEQPCGVASAAGARRPRPWRRRTTVRRHISPGSVASRRRRTGAGFSLIEALVGLAVLALILLAGTAVLVQHRKAVERLAAEQEALRALEAALEEVRAGLVAFGPDSQPMPLPPLAGGTHARGLRLWLTTRPGEPPGLWEVEVEARYLAAGLPRRRTLETLVWRPQSPP